jgi:hypothetical protein
MRRPTFTSTSPDPLVERRPVRRFAHGTVGWTPGRCSTGDGPIVKMLACWRGQRGRQR